MGEIPSLQGIAVKEPYVGHRYKYSSCVGCLLGDQRHFWLTNLKFAPLSNLNLKSHLNASGANLYFCCFCHLLVYFITQMCLAYECCLNII